MAGPVPFRGYLCIKCGERPARNGWTCKECGPPQRGKRVKAGPHAVAPRLSYAPA